LRRALDADEEHAEDGDCLGDDGTGWLEKAEEEHEDHVICRVLELMGMRKGERGRGRHTVVIVALDELEKGSYDDDDACDGTEGHGDTNTDFFALVELEFPEHEPGEEG